MANPADGSRPAGHPGAPGGVRVARPWVVKIGGRLSEDSACLERVARAAAAHPAPLVIVHGGGDAVSRLQAALGSPAVFKDGRRVTSADDLRVVEMVLSGERNKEIVRSLERAGRPAWGLSGCDGGLLRARPLAGLGRAGEPAEVRAATLRLLLFEGYTPVVSPVSLDASGQPLNVNADEAASAIATALGAARLLLLSDVPGVRDGASWREEIASHEVESLIAAGGITRGMIPKLRAGAVAARNGVGEVRIACFDEGAAAFAAIGGTRIRAVTSPAST